MCVCANTNYCKALTKFSSMFYLSKQTFDHQRTSKANERARPTERTPTTRRTTTTTTPKERKIDVRMVNRGEEEERHNLTTKTNGHIAFKTYLVPLSLSLAVSSLLLSFEFLFYSSDGKLSISPYVFVYLLFISTESKSKKKKKKVRTQKRRKT